jgi:glycosyltransferase involved in cell wall biosynthesis
MRVGFLTYGLDRAPAGIGRYAVELLRALDSTQQDLEIILLTTEREDPLGLWEEFEHHPLPGCRLLPALMTAGNLLLSQAARRYQLDILHDPNGIAPFFGPPNGAKRIVTIHDAFAYIYPETNSTLENWRYRWMLTKTARLADAVITTSQCSKKDLIHHLDLKPDQVKVTPEGVHPRFAPLLDRHACKAVLNRYGIPQPYLFYLGGINPRKNITRLLEIFSRVRTSFPEVRLVIGGKRQWATDKIDQALKRLKLENWVQFTGYVPDADLPALYTSAEVFIFPSLYEGFGLPPLEAMACGAPVVASSAGSLPEVVADAALTVNPYDVGEMVAAIKLILGDPVLRIGLRRRGLQRASLFTWEETARETLKIYQQLHEPKTAELHRSAHFTRSS